MAKPVSESFRAAYAACLARILAGAPAGMKGLRIGQSVRVAAVAGEDGCGGIPDGEHIHTTPSRRCYRLTVDHQAALCQVERIADFATDAAVAK